MEQLKRPQQGLTKRGTTLLPHYYSGNHQAHEAEVVEVAQANFQGSECPRVHHNLVLQVFG
jgi:hypothetical protein